MDIKYTTSIGLIIGLLFIFTVGYISHVKGYDQPKVSTKNETLMTQCMEIAKSITPEGADVSVIASTLFKEAKSRFF